MTQHKVTLLVGFSFIVKFIIRSLHPLLPWSTYKKEKTFWNYFRLSCDYRRRQGLTTGRRSILQHTTMAVLPNGRVIQVGLVARRETAVQPTYHESEALTLIHNNNYTCTSINNYNSYVVYVLYFSLFLIPSVNYL